MTIAMLQSRRRSMGAYYTPHDAAHFMAAWVYRGSDERLLEPSLGDGGFVSAVADVAATRDMAPPNWLAVEIDPEVANDALEQGIVRGDQLAVDDFHLVNPSPVDGVIGNPPYVRLRHLPQEQRSAALLRAEQHLGVAMSPIGSVWMPFVAHLTSFIRTGGRAALVLPLDITYVAYARPLWAFLSDNFSSLEVLRARERMFADINQDVVILLADGKGGRTSTVSYRAYETIDDLVTGGPNAGNDVSIQAVVAGTRAFQRALLPEGVDQLLAEIPGNNTFRAGQSATFNIGYVTGDNDFFHPGEHQVRTYELPATSLIPAVSNARRLRGQGLRTSGLTGSALGQLWRPEAAPSSGENRYIEFGVSQGISERYKCRVRKPWWRVPGVVVPDVIVTVFSETPLMMLNDANMVASNSLLCGRVTHGSKEQFIASWYNPLTRLSIALEVHSLGGGVNVLVPGEAAKVLTFRDSSASNRIPRIEKALLSGDPSSAYQVGVSAVSKMLGKSALLEIESAAALLERWRAR